MVPLLAMIFGDEVKWGPLDFAVAGALFMASGLAFEMALKRASNFTYRAAAGVAIFAALFLVWVNLAVGVIGDEGNPANAMYIGVLAVGFIGARLARLKPEGMARALVAMAAAQSLVGAIALVFRLGAPVDTGLKTVGVNGLFVTLFLFAALLFRWSARSQSGGRVEVAG
jgi:hypothetical protein